MIQSAYVTLEEVAINNRIARNLKAFRTSRNLTQRQLAQVIGRSDRSLESYENERNCVPAFVLVQLANHFDVPLVTFTRKQKGE